MCFSLDLPASFLSGALLTELLRAFPGMTARCQTPGCHIPIPEVAPLCWVSQEVPGVWTRWASSPVQDKGSENAISSLMNDKGSPPFSHQWFFFLQHCSSAVFSNKGIFFFKKRPMLKTSSTKQGKCYVSSRGRKELSEILKNISFHPIWTGRYFYLRLKKKISGEPRCLVFSQL